MSEAPGWQWVLRGATLDRDQSAEWVRERVEPERIEPETGRRPRGSQDYRTLHLGRGTKWTR